MLDRLLEFDAQPECAGVVIELIVPDHGAEVYKGLPAIGKNGYEAGGQVEVISDWYLILKGESGGIGSLVFGELNSDVPL